MSVSLTSNEELLVAPTRLGDLSVRAVGPADGRPTVLWSSMFVDSHTWDRMLPILLREAPDRRYLLIDPPGLGRSEPLHRRSTIVEAASAARDALHSLAVPEPVDWVGNAFGGHVGYELAAQPRVLRSFVAISAPVEPIAPALRRRIQVLKPLLRAFGAVGPVRSAVIEAMLTDASAADPAIRGVVIESLTRPPRASMALALRSFILDRVDVTSILPRIGTPSLYLASDDRGDWSPDDAERAASLTPRARAHTISGARTLVPLEQPEAVARELLEFWSGLAADDGRP
ncbi:alpha/beta fold hydrolase [Agromyces allii]|uniref:AB hydrolase-1 domain-containing protein n=1 Tax=Agromyces allii TaxID=393607 RepID=A0ABN2QXX7_9MICO|nr:alpha/beta hydrolase [Agromyces allii]